MSDSDRKRFLELTRHAAYLANMAESYEKLAKAAREEEARIRKVIKSVSDRIEASRNDRD